MEKFHPGLGFHPACRRMEKSEINMSFCYSNYTLPFNPSTAHWAENSPRKQSLIITRYLDHLDVVNTT